MVQWLGLHTLTAKGCGSVPGGGAKIPQAVWYNQKKKNYSMWNLSLYEVWSVNPNVYIFLDGYPVIPITLFV